MINGNDFCIAVVDNIGTTFKDKYGKMHGIAGFVNGHGDAPAIISYNEWEKDWVIGTHEFLHSLGLGDSESPAAMMELLCIIYPRHWVHG